ncbi:unnamed protein product [Kuraishia capsulata CBS 1993]|uniref:SWR1-complex protein 5 n=1 Tax=Kuraishia capsulata CBS 1993 TaxID=1382522 RepID=W6MIN6_9ASCO|nr:uncharacterized protein KUCA_T00000202001 [Kuraishia capsulata CBS 1993]CDK24242.1 unnamed protein product [Kuraishia capsulata CBS 1993]
MSEKASDEEYDESQDEDFDPSAQKEALSNSDEEGAEAPDEELSTEIGKARYANIESSEGGLIRTRNQRLNEVKDAKSFNLVAKTTNEDIDSMWEEMKAASAPKTTQERKEEAEKVVKAPQTVSDHEKIKIRTTYEFAGETVTEEKWVEATSEEAKAYLNSVKLKTEEQKVPQKPLPRRGPVKRKRPGLLDAVINNSSTSKLSTLEKSRLDWAGYVDKQGIKDELKTFNKGGFLQKQDFLARVEANKDQKYKDAKEAQKKK